MSLRYALLALVSSLSPLAARALDVQFSAGSALTVVGGYSQATLATTFSITNTGSGSVTLGLARQVVQEVPGSENSFCFGVGCYPPPVSIAPQPITLAAGAVDNSFIGDYLPNGQAGVTIIRYAIYDVNGGGSSADTAFVTITYDATQRVTGLAQDLANSTLLSVLVPNPAVAGTEVFFTIAADAPRGSSLRVVDMRDGRTVRSTSTGAAEAQPRCGTVMTPSPTSTSVSGSTGANNSSAGIAPGGCYGPGNPPTPPAAARTATTVSFSTAGLAAGVYGCQLVDAKGQPRAMRRLVVQ